MMARKELRNMDNKIIEHISLKYIQIEEVLEASQQTCSSISRHRHMLHYKWNPERELYFIIYQDTEVIT